MRIASRCAIDFARHAKAREKVMLSIRQADERDAEAFSEVLCASITAQFSSRVIAVALEPPALLQ